MDETPQRIMEGTTQYGRRSIFIFLER